MKLTELFPLAVYPFTLRHRRRKAQNIGGEGGNVTNIGGGGANSQQDHDVVTTSMRRTDVASTSFRCHVPTRVLINQYQKIIFLILKSDIIENSRIERNSFVSTFKSN